MLNKKTSLMQVAALIHYSDNNFYCTQKMHDLILICEKNKKPRGLALTPTSETFKYPRGRLIIETRNQNHLLLPRRFS